MPEVRSHTYLRISHVTGPGSVLVSLRFGEPTKSEPLVTIRHPHDSPPTRRHDFARFVREVDEGLREANDHFGTSIDVAEIEIVPNDYPTEGQVRFCTFKLVEHFVCSQSQADS